jgi:aryl-alcohol dehydrogenase-like predicted oxidoreductase
MVLNKFNIDLIQLPINILDQNLLIDGWLKKIKEKGIEIHARSVFLQGVLLMPRHTLPAYFSDIYNNIEDFIGHAHKLSLSCAELALGFVQNIDEIDKIIVGVNTINQLREIIEAKQVDLDIIEFRRISVNDPNYTNPSLWKL